MGITALVVFFPPSLKHFITSFFKIYQGQDIFLYYPEAAFFIVLHAWESAYM